VVTDVIPAKSLKSDKRETVLVTGARGFLGHAVQKLLRRKGYGVIALDRQNAEAAEDANSVSGRDVRMDITDSAQLRRLFESRTIDRIIHLAAILPTAAQQQPELATRVNIEGSLNLLELMRQYNVRRFVFGSSLSVYGTCSEDEMVPESHRIAPEDLYGASKLYMEKLGQSYRERHGLEFVSLRIGRVVGRGARSSTSAWRSQIFEKLRAGSPVEILLPYAPSERILLVHVDDVAKMLVKLMEAPRPHFSVYNAACESILVGDLKHEIERINPLVRIAFGDQEAAGNPRRLDANRFAREFHLQIAPIFEQLRKAADRNTRSTAGQTPAQPKSRPRSVRGVRRKRPR
jgi:nucleoside-diphosphate-sugar epimerase